MRAPCILVLSHLFEPSVDEVVARLTERGVRWHRFNVEEFPLLVRSTYAMADDGSSSCSLLLDSGRLSSADVTAIWFRRATRSALPADMQERDRAFAQDESASFLTGLLDRFDGRWVNDRDAERRYSNKMNQLELAAAIGFDVPETVVTNDASAVTDFVKRRGTIIFKPLSGYSPRSSDFTRHAQDRFAAFGPVHIAPGDDDDELEVTFTQVLTSDKLDSLAALSVAPAIFQEFVDKRSDIRVTVVGDRIFACRIHSQSHAATRVDFRRLAFLPADDEIQHEAIELDAHMNEKIAAYMRHSGLRFGCLDFVERANGSLAFLEINPSGQWLWVERMTGMPISDAVADLLIDDAPELADRPARD